MLSSVFGEVVNRYFLCFVECRCPWSIFRSGMVELRPTTVSGTSSKFVS
jgi:hypothetical protein